MAAKDVFHNTVKVALQKDGWEITDDPFYIRVGGVELYIEALISYFKRDFLLQKNSNI